MQNVQGLTDDAVGDLLVVDDVVLTGRRVV